MTAWKRCHKKTNDNMRDKKIIMWNFWDKKKKPWYKKKLPTRKDSGKL